MPNKIQLQIAEPCHENWNQMTAVDQGRYCQSCRKTVTDFSMMTDKEILNHLSNRGADVCGRFTTDQLHRPLISERRKKFSWAYVWNFVIATFLTVNYASAQQTTGRTNKVVNTNTAIPSSRGSGEGEFSFVIPEGIRKIEGTVMDSKTNEPIPYATVSVKGTSNKSSTDEGGKFSLSVMFSGDDLEIEVTAVGYATQSFQVSKSAKGKLSFYLDLNATILGEVAVSTVPISKLKPDLSCFNNPIVVGMVIIKEEPSITKKLERNIEEWTSTTLGRKEMTIYPNPLSPGSSASISVALKQTGDYMIEILNADGQIVYRQRVQIGSKQQTLSVSTDASWSKGVYWVRLTGSDPKNIIHSKLLLQ